MIPVIKIGNDFNLRLIVRRGDGTAEDFDGVEKIEVQAVKNGAAWVTVLPNSYYYGSNGIVVAKFVADDTLQEGEYRAKVKYTKNGRRYLAENCQAFLLTTCCYQLSTDTAESIDVTLDVQFSSDGKDGLSAYELAVANGEYTGDYSGYQEWLASLAGEVSVESANEYTDKKVEPINEYLNSIKNNIVKKNGDVEIKANDTENPATAKIFVNQNRLDLEVEGKGIHVDGAGTEFRGYHPIVKYEDISPYSKYYSTLITTFRNIEQKFNNFDFIRTVSDPNETDENAGGKIFNEIRTTSDGHQLDIAVYPTNGVNRGEHNVDEASTRIKMDAYGIIDAVSKNGKITIAAPSVALKGDVRYNPNKFGSSQNVINRKFFDNRAIYRCILYITSCANAQEWESTIKPGQGVGFNPGDVILTICYVEDSATYQVVFGEVDNQANYTETFVPAAQYHIYTNNVYNWSGATDSDGNNIEANNIYVVSVSDNAVTYNRVTKSYGNANNNSSGLMSAEDKEKLDGINTDGSIYRGLFEAAGAVYNEETGYYELNGLEDITEEQMGVIYADSVMQWGAQYPMRTARARTLFPTPFTQNITYWYFGCSTLESIRVTQKASVNSYGSNRFAQYCSHLKKILDVINIANENRNPMVLFEKDSLLEDFKIKALHQNATIEDSPLLTLATVSYLIEEATNTAAITVSVHPDVYVKLTDSTNTEWYAVNTAAQAKQISFATTDAQSAAISLMNVEEPAIKQETRGELIEIVAPAGYYLTQAGETNGRMYFTRKVFVNGDSLDNYRLATSDEYEVYKIEQQNNLYNG